MEENTELDRQVAVERVRAFQHEAEREGDGEELDGGVSWTEGDCGEGREGWREGEGTLRGGSMVLRLSSYLGGADGGAPHGARGSSCGIGVGRGGGGERGVGAHWTAVFGVREGGLIREENGSRVRGAM